MEMEHTVILKSNDLRVGNYLFSLYSTQGEKELAYIGSGGIKFCDSENEEFNSYHAPIQLTPEILTEACGFALNEFKEYHYAGIEGIFLKYRRFHSVKESCFQIYGIKDCFVQYLHELQNIIHACWQEELEIDEEKLKLHINNKA